MLLLTELELANVFQDWSLVATGTSTPTRTNFYGPAGLSGTFDLALYVRTGDEGEGQ